MAKRSQARSDDVQTALDASRFRADGGELVTKPDLSDLPLADMALGGFPDVHNIETLIDDEAVTTTTDAPSPDEIDPDNNVMLCMDGREVAEYLKSQQKKSDHWLDNEIRTLTQRRYNGSTNGMSRSLRLSDYDKTWLARREKQRRMEAGEWNPTPGGKAWQELPNAEPTAETGSSERQADGIDPVNGVGNQGGS